MTDAFWNNLGGILTAAALIVTSVWTLVKVSKVQTQTNSMNHQMVESAKKEGKAEVLETLVAAAPAIPLVVAPEAKQEEMVKWIAQGISQGIVMEKTRRDAANGVKTTDP